MTNTLISSRLSSRVIAGSLCGSVRGRNVVYRRREGSTFRIALLRAGNAQLYYGCI